MTNWARIMAVAAIASCCGGCLGSGPDCGGDEARQKVSDLFRKQLKLTPYVRFIDMGASHTNLEAIFTVTSAPRWSSCVAFVTYEAKLNEVGEHVPGRNKLLFKLLYVLGSEKQVYYTTRRTDEGHIEVHIDRVSG